MTQAKALQGKRVLITGGTGSLGQVLVRRLLAGEMGEADKIIVFSRDEAKQHAMRVAYLHRRAVTDEVIYRNFEQRLEFRIGDVRDYQSVAGVLRDADVVINAAALKQVPTCEYFPYEAVKTNIDGAENIVRAIQNQALPVQVVIGVSTDKACKPVNVMGMSKAIQERIFIQANMRCHATRFTCVRYGNVLASRGSVIPLFHDQIRSGGPVTITHADMTRFLLSLDEAVDLVFEAIRAGGRGETLVPRAPAARITDVAAVLIGERSIPVAVTSVRPGEKMHEIMVSEEEVFHTELRANHYAILPTLPELRLGSVPVTALEREYSSEHALMDRAEVERYLRGHRLMVEDAAAGEELLR